MLVSVLVAMLDASREVLEHYLDKKTDQDERSKIRPPIIADEHFRQQVQCGNREQVGAAEGDQQLKLVGVGRLDPQHRECRGNYRKYEKRVSQLA